MPLLEIKNLKMDFGTGADALRAVDGVSLAIGAGETVCLVGESGCGKSVTALSIAQLVPTPPANYVGGEILLNGRDVLKMSNAELRNIRGGVVSYNNDLRMLVGTRFDADGLPLPAPGRAGERGRETPRVLAQDRP